MVIEDGMLEELKEEKKIDSAIAISDAFLAWRNGMFPDKNFRYAARQLGLLENQYTKGTTNKVSEEELDEVIEDADEIIEKNFPEE